jgi:hypothetical protein
VDAIQPCIPVYWASRATAAESRGGSGAIPVRLDGLYSLASDIPDAKAQAVVAQLEFAGIKITGDELLSGSGAVRDQGKRLAPCKERSGTASFSSRLGIQVNAL